MQGAKAVTILLAPGSMRGVLESLAVVLTIGTASAASEKARDSAILQQIARRLETDNAKCSVEITYTGRLTTQRMEMPSRFDSALLVVYLVESCNGGNNWLTAAQVFGLKDETFRELGEAQAWSVVEGVDFKSDRALIRAVRQAPEDGHCCPTDGRTVEVTMQGDRPAFRQIDTWKARN